MSFTAEPTLPEQRRHRAVAATETCTAVRPERRIAFSPDGKLIAARLVTGELRIYTVPGLTLARTLSPDSPSRSFAFLAPRRLALGTESGSVLHWSVDADAPQIHVPKMPASIIALDFEPTTRTLGLGTDNGYVRAYRLDAAENTEPSPSTPRAVPSTGDTR